MRLTYVSGGVNERPLAAEVLHGDGEVLLQDLTHLALPVHHLVVTAVAAATACRGHERT